MDAAFLKKVAESIEDGTGAAVATVVKVEGSAPGKPGFKMLVRRDGTIDGTVGGGEAEQKVIKDVLANAAAGIRSVRFELTGSPGAAGGTKMVCGGAMDLLIEPFAAPHRLYIFGGGHCGMALSRTAAMTGFSVVVYDDRPEWASRERHPDAAEVICAPYAEVAGRVRFSKSTYLVIMTHSHAHDEEVLGACVGREHAYLGFIGSRAKVKQLLDALLARGRPRDEVAAIFAPIGVDIGSETPAEIAVSILAQLIAVRAGVTSVVLTSNPLAGPQDRRKG